MYKLRDCTVSNISVVMQCFSLQLNNYIFISGAIILSTISHTNNDSTNNTHSLTLRYYLKHIGAREYWNICANVPLVRFLNNRFVQLPHNRVETSAHFVKR